MKKLSNETLASEFMQPIIDYCRDVRGTLPRMVKWLEKHTGRMWHRQQIEIYLHPDPHKRREPGVGTALLLQAAFQAIIKKDTEK